MSEKTDAEAEKGAPPAQQEYKEANAPPKEGQVPQVVAEPASLKDVVLDWLSCYQAVEEDPSPENKLMVILFASRLARYAERIGALERQSREAYPKCLLCAKNRPPGTINEPTGIAVCEECRDAAQIYQQRDKCPDSECVLRAGHSSAFHFRGEL